jgi:hypothetical protein
VQRRQRVNAAVEGLVSFVRRLEPIAHGVAAHEARANFLAGELVEKFLLISDREMTVARPIRRLIWRVRKAEKE